MADIVILAVLLIIMGAAIAHIVKQKKKGVRCIGCPSAGTCHKQNCGCNYEKR